LDRLEIKPHEPKWKCRDKTRGKTNGDKKPNQKKGKDNKIVRKKVKRAKLKRKFK
jgi:hypothetical protein